MRYEIRHYHVGGSHRCEGAVVRGDAVIHYDVTFFADSASDAPSDLDAAEDKVRGEFSRYSTRRRRGPVFADGYAMHFSAEGKAISGAAIFEAQRAAEATRRQDAEEARKSYVSGRVRAGTATEAELVEYEESVGA